MSLFSGFSTAEDERLAMRLSRAMTEKTFQVMAKAVRMHRPANFTRLGEVWEERANGEPVRCCEECAKPWPCPTWTTLTNDGADEP